MNTNLIGMIYAILSTNYQQTEFTPVNCIYCTNAHHWKAVERYVVKGTNWVNTIRNGKVEALEIDDLVPSKTNSLARMITDPSKHVPMLHIEHANK